MPWKVGGLQEWEQYWVGELLVKEVPLPEAWDLGRKDPVRSLLSEGERIPSGN
jgi:hypothetical protein